MRYAADVAHYSPRKGNEDFFSVVPVEGQNAMEAARRVAEIAAARRYMEDGCVGFLSQTGDGQFFRASIGVQRPSREGVSLHGVTISIHVWPVE